MAEAAGAGGISAWQLLVSSATPTIIVCLLGAVGAAMARKVIMHWLLPRFVNPYLTRPHLRHSPTRLPLQP